MRKCLECCMCIIRSDNKSISSVAAENTGLRIHNKSSDYYMLWAQTRCHTFPVLRIDFEKTCNSASYIESLKAVFEIYIVVVKGRLARKTSNQIWGTKKEFWQHAQDCGCHGGASWFWSACDCDTKPWQIEGSGHSGSHYHDRKLSSAFQALLQHQTWETKSQFASSMFLALWLWSGILNMARDLSNDHKIAFPH